MCRQGGHPHASGEFTVTLELKWGASINGLNWEAPETKLWDFDAAGMNPLATAEEGKPFDGQFQVGINVTAGVGFAGASANFATYTWKLNDDPGDKEKGFHAWGGIEWEKTAGAEAGVYGAGTLKGSGDL